MFKTHLKNRRQNPTSRDMKTAFLIVAATFAAMVIGMILAPLADADGLDDPMGGVVMVFNSSGPIFGTGVLIAPNTVLTARHVITGKPRNLTVQFWGGRVVPATLLWMSSQYDVALLSAIAPEGTRTFSLDCRSSQLRERLWVIGHPGDLRWLMIPVTVVGNRFDAGTLLNGPLFRGVSGAGVFTDSGGVRGVISLKHNLLPFATMIPSPWFCEDVDREVAGR